MARARTCPMEVRPVSAERSIAVSPVSLNAYCGRTRSVARRVSGGAGGAAGGEGCDDGSARLPTRHRWQDAGALGCGGERTKLANAAALRFLSLLATGTRHHRSTTRSHFNTTPYHSQSLVTTHCHSSPRYHSSPLTAQRHHSLQLTNACRLSSSLKRRSGASE